MRKAMGIESCAGKQMRKPCFVRKLYFMCAAAARAVMLTISPRRALTRRNAGLYLGAAFGCGGYCVRGKRETGYDLDFGINALIARCKRGACGDGRDIERWA